MQTWDPQFALRSPMFAPLRAVLGATAYTAWPTPDALNRLAAEAATRSGGGQPLRFASLSGRAAPGAADYELRIHDDGVVPLRPGNWHDLFNALVWLAFPLTKVALNRAHTDEFRAKPAAARSVRRDALTLFDESGVLVFSSDLTMLKRIRAFDWKRVFWDERETLLKTTRCLLFGHGLYEKALSPYVGMSGHALLLDLPDAFGGRDEAALDTGLATLDAMAANAVQTCVMQPRDLSPLPVLGVPGWWDANNDAAFYDNARYFRPGRMRELLTRGQEARSEVRTDATG